MTSSKRVLVTNGEERSVLAACRALSLRGYKVTVAASDRFAVTHWSRACGRRALAPPVETDVAGFLDTVEGILSRLPHAVLLPGSDAALLAVSGARERFEPFVSIGLPSHEAVVRSTDKRALVSACRSVGLDVPETICCESLGNATEAAREIGFPLVVKPARPVMPANGGLVTRPSSVVDDRAALARAIGEAGGPYLLQRLEQGTTCSFAGLLVDGRLIGHVFSRYHRTWPARAGAASFSVALPPPGDLAERARTMAVGLGWQGIFELELLLLPRGRILAIDFNPRVYGSLALATSTGVNLPALWCDSLLAKRNQPSRAIVPSRAGAAYRREDTELRHAVAALRTRDVGAAVKVLRPRRGVAHAYFRADDPLPAVARAIAVARAVSPQRKRDEAEEDA